MRSDDFVAEMKRRTVNSSHFASDKTLRWLQRENHK
jgi:hypothetical protein